MNEDYEKGYDAGVLDTVEECQRLQHNWNELKRILNGLLDDENDFYSVMRIRDLLKIIKQIEEGGNNDN